MGTKTLTKEDLWCSVLGGAALATGGGGRAPTYEAFCQAVDPIFEAGLKPKLIDPMSLSDDDPVLMPIGIGGGITREDRERYGPPIRFGPYREIAFKEMDRVFPVLEWAGRPREDWREAAIKRLKEVKGEEKYVAYFPGEIGPGIYRQAVSGARDGVPVVDADCAGQRAVPELSFTSFNVKQLPATPAVIATIWGDLLVYEESLSWQRLEDITRAIALVSGGFNATMMSFKGKDIKESSVHGSYSKAIEVGRAIQEARESGDDPVDRIVEVTKGYKIFEGEVVAYTTEGKFAFTWGNGWIRGTGEFEGKLFRFWYKNENQISWLDGKPYVTCPDPFTVIDAKTGEGLSNFQPQAWTPGRKVAVVGVKAADIWRTERGLRIYNPRHFGFDIEYKPIEEIMEK
ncbi:hypothetical protein DRO56_00140 [Candidatus Bathyarchaeota archaeon]|nr:MAG: DUF917 domain-containing protein [Candidatus Bathyarchaeota archaeon]RLI34042.1 MAG: hypothetical protein DRO56_00140 [Candidatus Bathyarchaeota archaeon]